jgi:hypothetical protein
MCLPRFRPEPRYVSRREQAGELDMARMIGYLASVFALALSLAFVLAPILAPPAEARGGHGFGRGFHGGQGMYGGRYRGVNGASFAGDHGRADDAYVKSASAERDRLLNTQIKSICRGC